MYQVVSASALLPLIRPLSLADDIVVGKCALQLADNLFFCRSVNVGNKIVTLLFFHTNQIHAVSGLRNDIASFAGGAQCNVDSWLHGFGTRGETNREERGLSARIIQP